MVEYFNKLDELAEDLRDNKLKPIECTDCRGYKREQQCEKCQELKKYLLLFAYNRVGKTRLSMKFKDRGKDLVNNTRDTLYFNAFTEDLFPWDNDLDEDKDRHLEMRHKSRFFNGFKKPDIKVKLEEKIFEHLARYADFKFKICHKKRCIMSPEKWWITFSHEDNENIKISRGEQNIFIWCLFLAIAEFVLDSNSPYENINYLYIDDPISSLDDDNAIAVASDLARLLQRKENKKSVRTVIASHHGLFSNVLCNSFADNKNANEEFSKYFLAKRKNPENPENPEKYILRDMGGTPFSYHLAMLGELQEILDSEEPFRAYHLNILRVALEKTAIFLGFNNFFKCIDAVCDNSNYRDCIRRTLNVSSHGVYPTYGPEELSLESRELFKKFIIDFKKHYHFKTRSI